MQHWPCGLVERYVQHEVVAPSHLDAVGDIGGNIGQGWVTAVGVGHGGDDPMPLVAHTGAGIRAFGWGVGRTDRCTPDNRRSVRRSCVGAAEAYDCDNGADGHECGPYL